MNTTLDLLASMVTESGRPWGETAAPWQWSDAQALLDIDAPVRQHWWTRPRGARKTTDAAGLVLAILLDQAPVEARCFGGASDEDQAAELIDAAAGLVTRTGLSGAIEVTGLKLTNRNTGASFEALPMDASAMGKRAFLIVLDEITNWPDTRRARRFWGVLTSGNRKLADCRTLVITNAGEPEHWAYSRRETATSSKHWRLSEVPGPLSWLTAADIEVLRENAETDSEFRRLILNEWVAGEDALATREDVEACATLTGPLDRQHYTRYVVSLDLATSIDNAVGVVAHKDAESGHVVIDRLRVWTPRRGAPIDHADVERWLIAMNTEFVASGLTIDPHEARGMLQRLQAAGINAQPFIFSQSSVGRLGVLLHRLILERQIDLPQDDELIDELAHVRLRRTGPGGYRLDHDRNRHDDRAISIALAANYLIENGAIPQRLEIVRGPIGRHDRDPWALPVPPWDGGSLLQVEF